MDELAIFGDGMGELVGHDLYGALMLGRLVIYTYVCVPFSILER